MLAFNLFLLRLTSKKYILLTLFQIERNSVQPCFHSVLDTILFCNDSLKYFYESCKNEWKASQHCYCVIYIGQLDLG